MAGLYGALGTLLALQARQKTGQGQVVDIGLYEPIFRILDELAPAFQQTGFVRQRMGPGTVNVVPHSHYPTRDGRWIAIACTSDKIFARLAEAMGAPELAEPAKWGRLTRREAERAAVDGAVAAWTERHDRSDLLAMCEAAQVPCGPVYAIDEIFKDAQYAARGNILRVQDARIGELAVPNLVPRLSETPGEVRWLGPALGAHNDAVYRDMLGLDDGELRRLRDTGVI
jgi:crotonobetainyl-CoA:carnitine CoA-transferase CaiB-like acyl-CoA transferase